MYYLNLWSGHPSNDDSEICHDTYTHDRVEAEKKFLALARGETCPHISVFATSKIEYIELVGDNVYLLAKNPYFNK